MSWVNLLLLHCGHCLWDWTSPHGSRKEQTNVCTDQHHETILVVMFCSVFSAPPGAHICSKCACVFTPPVGYSGSLSTVNENCNKTKDTVQKKYCRCTSYKSLAHLNRVHTCSPHLRRPLVVIVPFWGVWWASGHYRSHRSYMAAAQSTSSEVLSDFQIWCHPGCQMHLD